MFYDKFVQLCNERGEYPTAVAERIGVNRSAASRWARGALPRDTTLLRLAEYFGVTVAYLTGEEGENATKKAIADTSDDGLEAALEALRNQPGRRALLSATKNMTEAQVLRFADWLADITGSDKD